MVLKNKEKVFFETKTTIKNDQRLNQSLAQITT